MRKTERNSAQGTAAEKLEKRSHNVIIEDRRHAVLSGVTEVESFDETEVVLLTQLGELRIRGKGLQIGSFDTVGGGLELTGEVIAFGYGEGNGKHPDNLITRFFR